MQLKTLPFFFSQFQTSIIETSKSILLLEEAFIAFYSLHLEKNFSLFYLLCQRDKIVVKLMSVKL